MKSTGSTAPKVVFRLSHLGDVALITGVLSYWHKKQGDTFIVVTRACNTPLLENHPAITRVVPLHDADLTGQAWFRRIRQLAQEFSGHDLIDFHGTLRSRLLALAWKGNKYSYPKHGILRRLYDKTHADCLRRLLEKTNVPQRYALALENEAPNKADLVPQIHLSTDERLNAKKTLSTIAAAKPLVAMHPYATHPAKQWPREHWLTLTTLVVEQGYNCIIIGRDKKPLFPNEKFDLTNGTNLRETCAILKEADVLVTADSGPMHLACGVGTPVAALFGPTVKAWGFFPAGKNDQILEREMACRPCSLHGGKKCNRENSCLKGITAEQVLQAITKILATKS